MKKLFCLLICVCFITQCAISSFGAQMVVRESEENVPSTFSSAVPNGDDKTKLPVEVKAKAAVLMDVQSGKVLLSYNPDIKLYPASVTKIMTILLVAEAIDSKKITLADKVTCSANAASKGGSQIWLEEGEQMTVDELLRATVIGSANDAATLLGEYISGSESAFVALMNARAKELGMKNTDFLNATGLDDTTEAHLTTALDIGIMSCELLKHDFITDYTTVWMDSLRNGKTELVNTNKLVRFYEGTTGLKTGTTAKAGCCVSASAKRDNLHLVAVVMGSENSNDRFETAKSLLSWGFSNYISYTPKIPEGAITSVEVIGGRSERADVSVPQIATELIKKGEEEKITVKTDLCENVSAPVLEGQTLGTVAVMNGENTLAEYKLTATNEVKKLTLPDVWLKMLNFLATGETKYPF
ncbi:MAG: D-alanyl-D-alanine carboxypeptidase [Clostridia bacterium]|nr:D-alanyl-D-alanine carboxypeptidase [Clostridia bacterium]